MSEKYFTIGAPMTAFKRPATSNIYNRIESSLNGGSSNGGGSGNCGNSSASSGFGSIKFHDCSLNASLTNLRDMVS